MNAYAPADEGLNRRLEEMMADMEVGLHDAVAYVDRVVIPEVRRESAGALRQLAAHLDRLADKIDPVRVDPMHAASSQADQTARQ